MMRENIICNTICIGIPRHIGCCNVCFSEHDVKEINFRGNNSGICVALCIDCREKLVKLLMDEEEIK